MTPPIDVTEINSIEDAKEALQTWKISEERAEFIAQALLLTKEPQKESKENLTKSLEFEKDTFKIDSTWWKRVKKWWRNVKINDTGDVTEYLDWDQKWEQIFITYDAFIREVCKAKNCSKEEVEKKYLMTMDEYKQKMKVIDEAWAYNEFYDKEVKDHLAGSWIPDNETFYNVGERSHVWLVGGKHATFIQNTWYRYNSNSSFGFSGRLLKN